MPHPEDNGFGWYVDGLGPVPLPGDYWVMTGVRPGYVERARLVYLSPDPLD